MAQGTENAIDWQPYEEEILSLFVKQNKTLEYVMSHMKQKYGLNASTKQYKTKFPSLKNLKADEWIWAAQRIQKRNLEGKDSEVCLHGRPLDPKRVKREIGRHQARLNDPRTPPPLVSSPVIPRREVFEIPEDIIHQAPSAETTDPVISHDSLLESLVEDVGSTELVTENALDVDLINISNNFSFNMDFLEFASVASWPHSPRSPSLTGVSHQLQRIFGENSSVQIAVSPHMPPLSEFVDFNSPELISGGFQLMTNLPWFQLQTLLEQPGRYMHMSPVFGEILRTSPPTPSPTRSTQTVLAHDERQNLLSALVISGPNLQIVDHVTYFSDRLQRLVPERYDGELSKKVRQIFNPATEDPMTQLFELAAYFSSNNMLSASQMDKFLRYVMDQKYFERLRPFLLINTPTIHAFATRLLEAGIRIKNTETLTHLLRAGIRFDSALERVFNTEDPEFIKFVLSNVSPNCLSGAPGGKLLHRIAGTSNVEIAQILVQHGAEVNISFGTRHQRTLHKAVSSGTLSMVQYLLESGALVNAESYGITPPTALGKAVQSGNFNVVAVLLGHGASISCNVDHRNIFEWSSLHNRPMYHFLLDKTGRPKDVLTLGDLLEAAEQSPYALQNYLSHYEKKVSKHHLERTLLESVRLGKVRATMSLLGHAVDPNCLTLTEQPLRTAISARKDRLQYCQLLINAGANVNVPGLLSCVAGTGDFGLLQLFMDSGANLHEHGPEALEEAAKGNHVEALALLLDQGTDINAIGKRFNCLQAAAFYGDFEVVQYLIDRGADVNAPASALGGRTALQVASEDGDVEVMKLLLARGADADAPPALMDGITSLEAASNFWEGDSIARELFNLLLDSGASVNRPDGRPSMVLHNLISWHRLDLLSRALQAGAIYNHMSQRDVEIDQEERTPLQFAADLGNLDAVKLLVEHGADINEGPGYQYGRTALQAAVSSDDSDMEVVEFLLRRGADVNAKPAVCGGITALQGGAIRGDIKIVRLLLERGADVNAAPALKEGRYAIEGAAEHGRLDMVQLLLNAGANGDVVWETGFRRAIELAEKNNHFAVANLLRAAEKGKAPERSV